MSQPQNRYKADLRDFRFALFEQFKLGDLLGKEPYQDWGEEEINMVIDQAYRFATEVTGPLNAVGDKGCRLENGQVVVPAGFRKRGRPSTSRASRRCRSIRSTADRARRASSRRS